MLKLLKLIGLAKEIGVKDVHVVCNQIEQGIRTRTDTQKIF